MHVLAIRGNETLTLCEENGRMWFDTEGPFLEVTESRANELIKLFIDSCRLPLDGGIVLSHRYVLGTSEVSK